MKIDETVKETKGTIEKMIPDHKNFMFIIKRDLIDTLTARATSTVETQTGSMSYIETILKIKHFKSKQVNHEPAGLARQIVVG